MSISLIANEIYYIYQTLTHTLAGGLIEDYLFFDWIYSTKKLSTINLNSRSMDANFIQKIQILLSFAKNVKNLLSAGFFKTILVSLTVCSG